MHCDAKPPSKASAQSAAPPTDANSGCGDHRASPISRSRAIVSGTKDAFGYSLCRRTGRS